MTHVQRKQAPSLTGALVALVGRMTSLPTALRHPARAARPEARRRGRNIVNCAPACAVRPFSAVACRRHRPPAHRAVTVKVLRPLAVAHAPPHRTYCQALWHTTPPHHGAHASPQPPPVREDQPLSCRPWPGCRSSSRRASQRRTLLRGLISPSHTPRTTARSTAPAACMPSVRAATSVGQGTSWRRRRRKGTGPGYVAAPTVTCLTRPNGPLWANGWYKGKKKVCIASLNFRKSLFFLSEL
jgi:hypothetical protein